MKKCFLESPLGLLKIEGNERGLTAVVFLNEKIPTTLKQEIPEELYEAHQQLTDYFAGKGYNFQLKLNPTGTQFQQKVWKKLQAIPMGRTSTYSDMAKQLGDLKTIRAAATANGKNPIAIIIPCHRVIGSDGSLTGYSGGLWRKKWLLDKKHEQKSEQLTLF